MEVIVEKRRPFVAAVIVTAFACLGAAPATAAPTVTASTAVVGTTTGAGTIFGSNCTSARGPRASEESATRALMDPWLNDAIAGRFSHLSIATTPAAGASGDSATISFSGSAVTAVVSRRQVTTADADSDTSTSLGTLSNNAVFSAAGRLQDCAPRPADVTSVPAPATLAASGALSGLGPSPSAFWNATTFPAGVNQLDAALFEFSEPVGAFGAWFGDLETRDHDPVNGAARARLKLFAADGSVIAARDVLADEPVVDDSVCGGDPTTDALGCGNQSTRFIGFVDPDMAVAKMLVIVGDDDSCAQSSACDGFSEGLSWVGPILADAADPTITLANVVVNDDGGTSVAADWTLRLDALAQTPGVAATVPAGSYTVTAVGPTGYERRSLTCTGGVQSGDVVTVARRAMVTCTFVHDDIPAPPVTTTPPASSSTTTSPPTTNPPTTIAPPPAIPPDSGGPGIGGSSAPEVEADGAVRATGLAFTGAPSRSLAAVAAAMIALGAALQGGWSGRRVRGR